MTVWVPPSDPRIIDGPVVQVKENVEVSLRCESNGGKPAARVNIHFAVVVVVVVVEVNMYIKKKSVVVSKAFVVIVLVKVENLKRVLLVNLLLLTLLLLWLLWYDEQCP